MFVPSSSGVANNGGGGGGAGGGGDDSEDSTGATDGGSSGLPAGAIVLIVLIVGIVVGVGAYFIHNKFFKKDTVAYDQYNPQDSQMTAVLTQDDTAKF